MVDPRVGPGRSTTFQERIASPTLDGEAAGTRLHAPQYSQSKRHPLSWSTNDQLGAAPEPITSGRSIRNRHSFFSRSRVTSPVPGDSATKPATNGRDEDGRHSALSNRAGTPESVYNESTRPKSSSLRILRQSFQFGKKRPESTVAPRGYSLWPRKRLSNLDRSYSAEPSSEQHRFGSEEEYHRCLKKNSISLPFNFHHVTHTARDNLPPLESVDEKELSARFWAIQCQQSPRTHLLGIKADELPSQPSSPTRGFSNRAVELGSAAWPKSPSKGSLATSTEKSLPELPEDSLFEEKDVAFVETHDECATLSKVTNPLSQEESTKLPKRTTSLAAPTTPLPEHVIGGVDSVVDLRTSGLASLEEEPCETEIIDVRTSSPNLKYVPNEAASNPRTSITPPTNRRSSLEHIIRSPSPFEAPKVPLPPTPLTPPSHKRSKLSPEAPTAAIVSGAILPDVSSSWRSSSSRTLHLFPNVPKSPASTHRPKQPSMNWNGWRDDIDFAYEQEMESTCDFNWDKAFDPKQKFRMPPESSAADRRASNYCPQSQLLLNANEAMHLRTVSSVASLANRPGGLHRSRPSVGHKGFAEARRGSSSGFKPSQTHPPMLELVLSEGPVFGRFSTIFPRSILSSIGGEGSATTTGSSEPAPSTAAPAQTAPAPPSTDSASASDPESPLTGSSSKHRKSSSHSSFESHHHRRRLSRKESNRKTSPSSGISTSSASMPDPLYPRRKSINSKGGSGRRKSSVKKADISRPSLSSPTNPNSTRGKSGARLAEKDEEEEEDSAIIPRALRSEPMRSAFVTNRRTSGSSDRETSQGTGGGGSAKPRQRSAPKSLNLARSPVAEHAAIPESPTFGSGSEAGWI